jgi:deoxyribonuclease-4
MTTTFRESAHDELGAHVSTAGGVQHAPGRAAQLSSRVLQLFTKQPSRWAEPVLTPAVIDTFRAERERCRITCAAAHDAYLINLASPDPVLRARSTAAFRGELERCAVLGLDYLVSHPGSATDGDRAGGLRRNALAIRELLEQAAGDVVVLLETTPGAGTCLGARFAELGELIAAIDVPERVGVCVDTCHVWVAGYDLRSDYQRVIAELDETIGLSRVRLFHLNDSLGPCGSRRDRHAHIGQGELGAEPFRALLNDPRFARVPKLLETPKDPDALAADRANLARLRGYRSRDVNKGPGPRKDFSESGRTRGRRSGRN